MSQTKLKKLRDVYSRSFFVERIIHNGNSFRIETEIVSGPTKNTELSLEYDLNHSRGILYDILKEKSIKYISLLFDGDIPIGIICILNKTRNGMYPCRKRKYMGHFNIFLDQKYRNKGLAKFFTEKSLKYFKFLCKETFGFDDITLAIEYDTVSLISSYCNVIPLKFNDLVWN